MIWQEIRTQYPRRWLLVEALEAHSTGSQRILDRLAVIDAFDDAGSAMKGYSRLHHQAPQRELYVLHTDRERLDIQEEGTGRLWNRRHTTLPL